MRNLEAILYGTLVATISGLGCGQAAVDTSAQGVGKSQAQLSLATSGDASATQRVTATDDVTGAVVLDQSVDVRAGSPVVLHLDVAPASYTFEVRAYADGTERVLLGSGVAHADLKAEQTTRIVLTTVVNGSGSAQVQAEVDVAPQILGSSVELGTGGSLGTSGDTLARVHVDAVDSAGGALSYYWSGFGIGAAVKGSSTIDLSSNAAETWMGPHVVHVVVQDGAGATATTSIAVNGVVAGSVSASADGGLSINASADANASVTVSSDGGGASASACADVNIQCTASCDAALAANPTAVTAHASCLTQCSLSLASCLE